MIKVHKDVQQNLKIKKDVKCRYIKMYTENYNIGLYFVLYKKDNIETFLNTKERPITEHNISFESTKNLPQGCVANHKHGKREISARRRLC